MLRSLKIVRKSGEVVCQRPRALYRPFIRQFIHSGRRSNCSHTSLSTALFCTLVKVEVTHCHNRQVIVLLRVLTANFFNSIKWLFTNFKFRVNWVIWRTCFLIPELQLMFSLMGCLWVGCYFICYYILGNSNIGRYVGQ